MTGTKEPYTKITMAMLVQSYRHDGVCYAQHLRLIDSRYENPLGVSIPKPEDDTFEPVRLIQPYDLLEAPLTDEVLSNLPPGQLRAVVSIHLGELSWEISIEHIIRRKALKSETYQLINISWLVVGFDEYVIHVNVGGEIVAIGEAI